MEKNTKLTKRILALALSFIVILTMLPFGHAKAAETQYYGGQEIAWQDFVVYNSTSWTTSIGKIYKYEGFTVLLQNAPSGYLWVEYSTSSGTKRGYIQIPNDEWGGRTDGLARVTTYSNVYYGNDTSKYKRAGSVSANEIVAILAKNGDWVYIEYNTTSGRKRGYMLYSNLEVYNRPGSFDDLYTYNTAAKMVYMDGKYIVYSGPTSLYSKVGSVTNEYVCEYSQDVVLGTNTSYYIEYLVDGTDEWKSGFIVFGPTPSKQS